MARKWKRALLVVMALAALALLWRQVFTMTGVLWWDAPLAEQLYPRPAAPTIRPPADDWVNVEAYLKTHPVWDAEG